MWSLLRSGKYSCPITKEPFSSPNKKGDLNKCMMCQRLLERDSKTQGSGGEVDRNVNSLGKDECREFRDLFKRGKLSCTRENDPVRDASGKQHSNKCIMCAEKFKRENEQKLSKNRQGKDKDDCSEFRSQFEAGGRLSCTRENAPVRDASGRQHINKCLMCAEKFKKEAQREGGNLQRNKLPASERTKQKNCGGSRQGVNERRPFSSSRGSNGVQTASKYQGSAVTKGCSKGCLVRSVPGAQQSSRRTPHVITPGQEEAKAHESFCLAAVRTSVFPCKALPTTGSSSGNFLGISQLYSAARSLLLPSSSSGVCNTKTSNAFLCRKGAAFGVQLDCSQYSGGITKDGRSWVACPRDLKPVCGTDGNTYSNDCGICLYNAEHSASVEKEHDGECDPKPVVVDCSNYHRAVVDDHVLVACPRIMKPVCGSDSFTYDNDCGICAYNAEHDTNVTKIHEGPCKESVAVDCTRYRTQTTKDGKTLVLCPRDLNPVCGTDDTTYDNECTICAHNAEKRTHVGKRHSGQCREKTDELDCSKFPARKVKGGKDLVRCPRILHPVCGTDGFTYDNDCSICAHNVQHGTDVKKSHDGRCKEESTPVDCSTYLSGTKSGEAIGACPFILREICGTDGVTYSNDCALCAHNIEHGTQVAKKHDGRCIEEPPQLNCSRFPRTTLKDGRELMACTMIYDPVCATDGVTYASECTLCAHNMEHRTNLGKRKNGPCEEDITRALCKDFKEVSPICTMDYVPHCGSDGKTYSNRCIFCNAYLESGKTLNLMSLSQC